MSSATAPLGPIGRFTEKVGVGFALCVLVLGGLWGILAWAGPNIIKPFVDQKIAGEHKLVNAVEKLAAAADQTSRTLQAVEYGIERLNQNQDAVRENGLRNAETIRQQAADMRELLNTVKRKPDSNPMGGDR